jgi:LysM repeat protein
MRIGIDPTGGQDWQSPAVVWSSELNALDIYTQFAVEAQAQGDAVTVFTYTTFDWPAPVNNVYWDDAALVVVGGGESTTNTNPTEPGTTSTNPTLAPAAGPGTIATQPPDPDGTQYHVVRSGETLGGIAVAYGVTAQEIRDLNGISGDVIQVGQKLLFRRAVATPIPTSTPTPVMTVEAPTPTPQEVAAVPETGELCVALFQDMNSNGQREEEELLVAGGTVSLSGPANDSYLTDGSDEPHCFSKLPLGDYTVSVSAPSGYSLVTVPSVQTAISGGSEILLSFGVAELSAAPENSDLSQEDAASNAAPASRSTMLLVGGIGAVLLLAALGGLAAYFFVFRKRASIE